MGGAFGTQRAEDKFIHGSCRGNLKKKKNLGSSERMWKIKLKQTLSK